MLKKIIKYTLLLIFLFLTKTVRANEGGKLIGGFIEILQEYIIFPLFSIIVFFFILIFSYSKLKKIEAYLGLPFKLLSVFLYLLIFVFDYFYFEFSYYYSNNNLTLFFSVVVSCYAIIILLGEKDKPEILRRVFLQNLFFSLIIGVSAFTFFYNYYHFKCEKEYKKRIKFEQNKDQINKYLNKIYKVNLEKYYYCDKNSIIGESYSIKLLWDNNSSKFTIKNFDNNDNNIEAIITRIGKRRLMFRTLNNSGFTNNDGEINEEMEIDFRYYTETKSCGMNFNIRSKPFLSEKQKEDMEFQRLRKIKAIYSKNPNKLSSYFDKSIALPIWHQNKLNVNVTGIVQSDGKFKKTSLEYDRLEKYLKFNADHLQVYLDEINRSINLMDNWLPKLNRDSIAIESRVNFSISLYNNGPQYHPHFGIHKMQEYFYHNLKYPHWHPKWQTPSFEVQMVATVKSTGELIDINVISNGASKYFNDKMKIEYYSKEAVRTAYNMGLWIPEKDKDGNKIESKVGLYATF